MCGCNQNINKEKKIPIELLKELSIVADALDEVNLHKQANNITKIMRRISQQAVPAVTAPTAGGGNPTGQAATSGASGSVVDFGDGPFTTTNPDLIAAYAAIKGMGGNVCPGSPPSGLPASLFQCLANIPVLKPRGGGNYTPQELANMSAACLLQTLTNWICRANNPAEINKRAGGAAKCFQGVNIQSLQGPILARLCELLAGGIPGIGHLLSILKRFGFDIIAYFCDKLDTGGGGSGSSGSSGSGSGGGGVNGVVGPGVGGVLGSGGGGGS